MQYLSDFDVDLVYALTGCEGPYLKRVVEYTYIPDQTDEDYQEAARVEIHAVRLLRPVRRDYTPDDDWQPKPRTEYLQCDVMDLLDDAEMDELAAETLEYHEWAMRRARKYAAA